MLTISPKRLREIDSGDASRFPETSSNYSTPNSLQKF
jgi:hypothetical protein